MQKIHKVRHRQADVDGLEVFFREAGHHSQPTVLLLHGFPARRTRSARSCRRWPKSPMWSRPISPASVCCGAGH
jgi:pimeloyl-ACP methyl ester carboxylesterase